MDPWGSNSVGPTEKARGIHFSIRKTNDQGIYSLAPTPHWLRVAPPEHYTHLYTSRLLVLTW